MMMFRVVLVALLTVALNVAAVAHCRVGAMSMDGAGTGDQQSASHDHQSDCGKSDKRVCDAMVQLTAPNTPDVSPTLDAVAYPAPVFLTAVSIPLSRTAAVANWHPPNRAPASFKSTYARTGRLLV